MKHILVILLLLSCLPLMALNQTAFVFMQIPPSSITRAMGYGYAGVADVWHQNALVAWDNPAIPAMHEGISYGITEDNWLKGSGIDDLYFHSGMLTVGYKGIGIILPGLNAESLTGTRFVYENHYLWDDNNRDSFDTAQQMGIACNPMQFVRATGATLPTALDWIDVAAGAAFTDVSGQYDYTNNDDGSYSVSKGTASVVDVGLLAHFKKQIPSGWILESSLGFKKYNVTDAKGVFTGDRYTDPVGANEIWGMGLSVALPPEAIPVNYPFKQWSTTAMSLRVLGDANFSPNINPTSGIGAELGLADALYLRAGYYDDQDGHIYGYTLGYGVNLHFLEFMAIECNYANFPGGDLVDRQESWDGMIMFDLIQWLRSDKTSPAEE